MAKFMKLLNNISRSQAIYRAERIDVPDLQSGHYAFALAICREPGRSQEELAREHSGIPHGGVVLRSGRTGWEGENTHLIEYKLQLDSNPEFTASVIVAYARAAVRLAREGAVGCRTVLDIPPAYLSPKSNEELRASLL